jgi:hypothetical protein
MLCGVTLGLAAAAVAPQAAAGDYYVSSTGDDTNPGTQAQPWATVAPVNRTSFAAGDTVNFEGEKTFSGTIDLGSDDEGTPLHPIVITSFGPGQAVIDGGDGSAMSIRNTGGLSIRNLVLKGSGGSTNSAAGLDITTSLLSDVEHIYIDSVEVYGFGDSGINVTGGDGSGHGFRDLRVTNVLVHDNVMNGMWMSGFRGGSGYSHHDVYVGHSVFHHNLGNPPDNSGNGVVIGGIDGAIMEYNIAYENGTNCNHPGAGPVGIWSWESHDVVIQWNESHHNHTGAQSVDGGGFDLDGGSANCVMQYNYSHDNDGAGYLVGEFTGSHATHDNVVRYNISENDGRAHGYAGLQFYAGTATHAYQNTIFCSPADGGPSAVLVTGGSGHMIRNNLIVTADGTPLLRAIGGTTVQGNAYYAKGSFLISEGGHDYDSLAAFRASGQETDTGFQGDPQLTDPGNGGTLDDATKLSTLSAYRLLAASPVIDKGVDLKKLGLDPGMHDFYGNVLYCGAGPDVGADEHCAPSSDGGASDGVFGVPADARTDRGGNDGSGSAGEAGWASGASVDDTEQPAGQTAGCGCEVVRSRGGTMASCVEAMGLLSLALRRRARARAQRRDADRAPVSKSAITAREPSSFTIPNVLPR